MSSVLNFLIQYKSIFIFYLAVVIFLIIKRKQLEFQAKIIILYRMKFGLKFIEKCARPEWIRFKDRFDKYRPYFQCMPFYYQIKEIEKYINDVDKYLADIPTTKKEFIDMDISISVKSIKKILEEIDNAYIKSEQT